MYLRHLYGYLSICLCTYNIYRHFYIFFDLLYLSIFIAVSVFLPASYLLRGWAFVTQYLFILRSLVTCWLSLWLLAFFYLCDYVSAGVSLYLCDYLIAGAFIYLSMWSCDCSGVSTVSMWLCDCRCVYLSFYPRDSDCDYLTMWSRDWGCVYLCDYVFPAVSIYLCDCGCIFISMWSCDCSCIYLSIWSCDSGCN